MSSHTLDKGEDHPKIRELDSFIAGLTMVRPTVMCDRILT